MPDDAHLAEAEWFEDVAAYGDYLADFSAKLHDIRADDALADRLAADSYVAS